MRMDVFRLEDRKSGEFRGIVVIFMTVPQQVWRRLTPVEHAEQIPHSTRASEADALRAELEALPEGKVVDGGPGLLAQILADGAVSEGHRPVYVHRRDFTSIIVSEASFRSFLEDEYKKLA